MAGRSSFAGIDDPTPIAITIEPCDDGGDRYRWHLTDTGGVSVRVSPESYAAPADAQEVGRTALAAFGAAAGSSAS